ncbi:MAG TPA: hypothetical protein VF691_00240 [Cytophagaceae bacterium]
MDKGLVKQLNTRHRTLGRFVAASSKSALISQELVGIQDLHTFLSMPAPMAIGEKRNGPAQRGRSPIENLSLNATMNYPYSNVEVS